MKNPQKFLVALTYYFYNHFISNFPSYSVRHFYLRHILSIKIGKGTAVHMGCFFTGNKIIIGNNTVLNRKCYIDGRFGVEIGNNINISPECYLVSLTHDINSDEFKTLGKNVIIEDYCWLGVRSLILPGVQLKKGCVVGAGSVVTKSFDVNHIIAGIPAKVIGKRNGNYNYVTRYFPFFDTDVTS